MTTPPPQRPIPATIAAVVRDGHVLLVRRANPPDAGCWAFPGGKIDAGERLEAAVARELLEETGVRAEPLQVFDAVDVFDGAGALRRHFILIAVLCRWQSGEPVAGDDASDARWVPLEDLDRHALATSFGVAELAHKAAALSAAL
jgi:mutator protein MutT